MKIILASTSVYRAALLHKLSVPFTCQAPHVDESAVDGESIHQQVKRLAELKAQAVALSLTEGYVIGSDQLASYGNLILGKPGNYQNAFSQLSQLSGQSIVFYTGLCLINAANGQQQSMVECFEVEFKQLSNKQIQRYLELEQPFDCAGSFKCEGLGIALFKRLNGRDPNTLVGLPLIALTELFANWQIDLFDYMQNNT
ncbi:Maf family protein [Paraglaciecola hydrolytica]|uniref:7-methyl-GTP pyrophosphatase n=1 Tax=Paraglaciecola hydrolytica TaxID=1799789 RepID=A0A136A0I2_9ALTE|nr:Maf family protein [Paraglaciecola hydrolytica]KXI28756.1 septum formation inhibitor Maf [Paraglaciecola hydrolytica]